MPFAHSDPLRERLHDVVAELRENVAAMCEAPPIEDLDTGQLIRFEEDLSLLTSAAKEAVSLRRRLRVEHDGGAFDAHGAERREDGDSGRASPG